MTANYTEHRLQNDQSGNVVACYSAGILSKMDN